MTKYVIRYWRTKAVTEEKETCMTMEEIKATLRGYYLVDLPEDAPDQEWLDCLRNEINDDPDNFSWEHEMEDEDTMDRGLELHKQG